MSILSAIAGAISWFAYAIFTYPIKSAILGALKWLWWAIFF